MTKYYLAENQLTDRKNDWMAIAVPMAGMDKESFITEILDKGSTLTRTDILAVFNVMEEVAVKASLAGYTINLPLFNTSFSISGVFDGPHDTFDGNRHKLNINITKGTVLRGAEKQVTLEKTQSHTAVPISEVKDSSSGKTDECITVPGAVEVSGYNIKIEGDDPTCGLWFVAENGTAVKAVTFIENKPSRVVALTPALDAANGACQVKIVTQFSGSNLLKTPKVFVYPKNLTVING
jgi:hypothetical protein